MNQAAQVAYFSFLFALGLWAAIKIADRHNYKNTFSLALVIGFIFALCSLFGQLIILIPVLALILLLIRYYQLTFMQIMLVLLFICIIFWGGDISFRFVKALIAQ